MTVNVCPEKDIECGRNPSRWCDTCPNWTAHLVDETEPGWAFKNVSAPSDLKIGDYVFASRWPDADPGDPWNIGYVRETGPNWVLVDGHGFSRRYPNAMRITGEQAERILARYPALEKCRKIPYKEIYEIFNGRSDKGRGCSTCGISGIHACPGAPIEPWTNESKLRLSEVLGQYLPVSKMTLAGFHLVEDPTLKPGTVRVFQSHGPNISTGTPFLIPTYDDIESAKQDIIDLKKTYTTLNNLKQRLDGQRSKAEAFTQIRDLVNGADQDGVLAKIRAVVNNL